LTRLQKRSKFSGLLVDSQVISDQLLYRSSLEEQQVHASKIKRRIEISEKFAQIFRIDCEKTDPEQAREILADAWRQSQIAVRLSQTISFEKFQNIEEIVSNLEKMKEKSGLFDLVNQKTADSP